MSSIPQGQKTMKAARVLEKGAPYTLVDVPVPSCSGPWDILIKVKAAGHCHTDVIVQEGGTYDVFPITGSHEPVGEVAKLGEEARKMGFDIGSRVGALNIRGPCGKCYDCNNDEGRYCPDPAGMIGLTVDGGFAEYCLLDARYSVLIPESLAWDQAAPQMCAGTTVYKALDVAIKTAGLEQGAIVGIVGLGALGHIAVQMARAMGYIVVGVDARPEPVEMTRSLALKPHLTVNSAVTSASDAFKEIAALDPAKKNPGVDACLVTTDAVPAQRYAADIMANHGTFVLVGAPTKGVHLNWEDFIFKDIRLVGTKLGEAKDAQAAIDLVAKHNIAVTTKTYALQDIEQLVQDSHSSNKMGKAVVVF